MLVDGGAADSRPKSGWSGGAFRRAFRNRVVALALLSCLIWDSVGCAQQPAKPILPPAATTAVPKPDPVNLERVRKNLLTGEYQACIDECGRAISERAFGEEWYLYKADAEWQIGDYEPAWETIHQGLVRYMWSIRLREVGHRIARYANREADAATYLTEIADLAGRSGWRYTDADSLVSLGRAALLQGADARVVLEKLYDRALLQSPRHRDARLAAGELALSKQDFALAADLFRAAEKDYPEDPEVQFGLTRALATSLPGEAAAALTKTLDANPKHAGAWLLRIERTIDGERYDEAERLLNELATFNPRRPEVWAFRSILATLRNEPLGASLFRDTALRPWPGNAEIDHLIGRKLSQKYRFREGAAAQRRSLEINGSYIPAQQQLAVDLLRLGDEEEGWQQVAAAHEADQYDVQLFNLVQLRDEIEKYRTLTRGRFHVRMEPREADLYGEEVLDLLEKAEQTLCPKYGLTLDHPVIVEIFPEPNDFAVRTFGMPGAGGYLGVCFGRVITANSPASQIATPANWQSVLWHEFCHVVTLELTRNRMPRWLSEGISVYEERLANPAWGQRMNPTYRKMILGGGLTPIPDLSQAFLNPETPLDLNFAYFEASLVVEYIVRQYGFPKLQLVLQDLAAGLTIDEALERRLAAMPQLDAEFADDARESTREFAPDVDWENYDLSAIRSDDDPDRVVRWLEDHPNSYQGLNLAAQQFIERQEFEKAKAPLAKLIELYPQDVGPDNPYELLSGIQRVLKNAEQEREVLRAYVKQADAATVAYLRLMELEEAQQDWAGLLDAASRQLAVNPLIPAPHRARAIAAEAQGQAAMAVRSWKGVLALQPDDVAEVQYRLAVLERGLGHRDAAKRHVLLALEAAPRYREAQQLLLELVTPPEVKP